MEHYSESEIITLYFQGEFATRTQACKYAGPKGLDIRVSDGQVEHVFNPRAPQLLHNIFTQDELGDVEYERSYNPLHWLSSLFHCFGQSFTYNVYGTSSMPHNNLSMMNFSGPDDVRQCLYAIESCIRQYPQKKLVLFGTSRGASVLMIALGTMTQEQLERVKLVILEAPFSSYPSLLFHTYPSFLVPVMLSALEKLTLFRRDQLSPLEAISSHTFPVRTPLLFVTSKADRTVPPEETEQLIEMLRLKGYLELHHLQLAHSHHSRMSLDHPDDIRAYQDKLASLYKHYLSR